MDLPRFDRAERFVHWANATLMLTVIATGSALYIPPISQLVGRRLLMKTIHVYAGVALPLPFLVGLARRSGAALRADGRRLNRWSAGDRQWLRNRRDPFVQLGKFNPGQKLNAAFTVGTIVVALGTGLIMRFPSRWPLSWRTGATFVHDWLYLAVVVVVTGHILFAVGDRESLRSMVTGRIPTSWARHRAPLWFEEMTGEPASPPRRPRNAARGRTRDVNPVPIPEPDVPATPRAAQD